LASDGLPRSVVVLGPGMATARSGAVRRNREIGLASVGVNEDRVAFAAPSISDDEIASVCRVLESGWLTTGQECLALEVELADYLGVPYVVAMSSCTAAMETTAAALHLSPGAMVAVPTWTFVSTATSFTRFGAVPLLLDVDADSLNVSVDAVGRALEMGVRAVVVVHFGGVPVDPQIYELCRDAGVPVVEDAAHALGSRDWRGRIGGQGTLAACFSFYATKNVTCGEGGALATEDPELATFANAHRLHGLSLDTWARHTCGENAYELVTPGIKANLPDLLAAVARAQLARFDELQARRRRAVIRYREQLSQLDGVRCVPGELHKDGADHLMVVVLPENVERDRVIGRLGGEGVGTSIHFQPLHRFDWFRRHAQVDPAGLDVAEGLAHRALSLPLHPELSDSQIDRVCAVLADAITAVS
jgi:dTDP-4-amino-4,6-dideoxygalactose transaminase